MNPFNTSLVSRIRFLGFALSIFMIMTLALAVEGVIFYIKRDQAHMAIELHNQLDLKTPLSQKYLQKRGLVRVSKEEVHRVQREGTCIVRDVLIRSISNEGGLYLYWYDGYRYSFLHVKNRYYYYKSIESYYWQMIPIIVALFILFFLTLYGIYYYVRLSLTPLLRLQKNIHNFSNAKEMDIVYESSNDEIAQVANAFYKAFEKSEYLKKQRDMYIRSIMHEVKTPLTKARFLTHFLDENLVEKKKFEKLFESMQEELHKLTQFEKISSKVIQLRKTKCTISRLIDEVTQTLLLSKDELVVNSFDLEMEVDETLFKIVLKNLIDNALKYSSNLACIIELSRDSIAIKNRALELRPLELKSLIEPFKQEDESVSGMGLGLYLVNEIVEKHDFTLEYSLQEEFHVFKIKP